MSIITSAPAPVNLNLDLDLDHAAPDAPSATDLAWAVHHLNAGRPDYFVVGEPTPLPSDDDAPADAPDPEGDAPAVGAAYATLDDLLLGRPVSVRRYNAARTALGYDALPAECACLDEPHCSCGNRLREMGLRAYEQDARERLADYDEWLDEIAEAEEEAAHDACERDLCCWRS